MFDQKWESDLLQIRELRPVGSSRIIIEFYHLGMTKVFHWSQQKRQVTTKLQGTVAKELRETATENVQCSKKDYIHLFSWN